MDERSVSIKVYLLRLLLQVTFALNHAKMQRTNKICYKNMINKSYAKVILIPSFH
jgi:hypothetical protein